MRDRLKFKSFQAQYANDRVAFWYDCFDWTGLGAPKEHQIRTLSKVDMHDRVSLRSPHGLGKSAMLAICVHHGVLCFEEAKIPTTASAWRQLDYYLWPEIHKWAKRIRWDKIGYRGPYDTRQELLTLQLQLYGRRRQAFAVACDDPATIEGAHAPYMLYGFDESRTIPFPTWDAAEGAYSAAGLKTQYGEEWIAKWVALTVPGAPFGRFYDIQARKPGFEDWVAERWTLEDGLESGMISERWANQRMKQWGANSPMYRNRVLGEFASYDENALIPLDWIEAAIERWYAWRRAGSKLPEKTVRKIGVDPAGGGDDRMALVERYTGLGVTKIDYYAKTTEMEATGICIQEIHSNGQLPWELYVEVGGGYGGGIVSRLREQDIPVTAVVPSGKSTALDVSGELGFLNMRAQTSIAVRDWLNPDNGYDPILPPDDRLIADLTAVRMLPPTSTGKIQVEKKEDMMKADRLGRSPDAWDALRATHAPIEHPPAMESDNVQEPRKKARKRGTGAGKLWH